MDLRQYYLTYIASVTVLHRLVESRGRRAEAFHPGDGEQLLRLYIYYNTKTSRTIKFCITASVLITSNKNRLEQLI